MLAEDVVCFVPFDLLGTGIPRLDVAVGIEREDGVLFDSIDQRFELVTFLPTRLFRVLAVRYVIIQFDAPARIRAGLDGLAPVFEPARLALVARRHVTLKLLGVGVVVVGRQDRVHECV